jgi:hypothetical protein
MRVVVDFEHGREVACCRTIDNPGLPGVIYRECLSSRCRTFLKAGGECGDLRAFLDNGTVARAYV